jgi:hypothetical protein
MGVVGIIPSHVCFEFKGDLGYYLNGELHMMDTQGFLPRRTIPN